MAKARPKTANFPLRSDNGFSEPPTEYVQLTTEIGESILSPGLKQHIEKLCDTTQNQNDKAKALELLTSIDLADNMIQRPVSNTSSSNKSRSLVRCKTAIGMYRKPDVQECKTSKLKPSFDPYETSYKVHYPIRKIDVVTGTHPMSTKYSFRSPSFTFQPPACTTYTSEFGEKSQNKGHPYHRTGSSSGNRNNNPHPSEEFLVWRFPRRRCQSVSSTTRATPSVMQQQVTKNLEPIHGTITNEEFDRAIRGKYESIYQTDFLGVQPRPVQSFYDDNVPQFHAVSANSSTRGDDANMKHSIKKDNQTITQTSYTNPRSCVSAGSKPIPQPPTTRFASNSMKSVVAKGVVPGVISGVQLHLLPRTSYDLEINDPAVKLHGACQDIRSVGRSYAVNSLKRLMKETSGKERRDLDTLIQTMKKTGIREGDFILLKPKYDATNRRGCLTKCPTSLLKQNGDPPTPTWISSWAGP